MQAKGVHAIDIAKTLIDRGFHPPTVYFPTIVHEAVEAQRRIAGKAIAEAHREAEVAQKKAQAFKNFVISPGLKSMTGAHL